MDYTRPANRAIVIASKHTRPTHRTSAGIALQDAIACWQSNRQEDAYNRALTSLRYSVGIGHEAYKKALGLTPRKEFIARTSGHCFWCYNSIINNAIAGENSMTITHGTRKIKVFSTGPKLTHEVIRGYYLVLPNGDRHWLGEVINDAARAMDKACDKYLSEKDGWQYWADYCYGYDVEGKLAWANVDFSDAILHRADNM